MKRMARWLSLALVCAFAGAAWSGEDLKTLGQEAIAKSGKWLLAQANPDGTFGKSKAAKAPGVVGLALQALATRPTPATAAEKAVMDRAAAYLAACQQANGAINLPGAELDNYNTSVAVIALTALQDPKYKPVLDKARAFIESCQLTEKLGYKKDEHTQAYGGFGYGSATRADLSNTTFSLEALKAMGVPEDSPAFKNALVFVQRCQDNPEENDAECMKDGDGTGGFVYLPGQSEFGKVKSRRTGKDVPRPYANMTYTGIKCLIYCGLKHDDPHLQKAWAWIKNNYAVNKVAGAPPAHELDGYFYYLVAFAKAFYAAQEAGVSPKLTLADGKEVVWHDDLVSHLVKLQKPDGSFLASTARWWEDDPVLTTSYAAFSLNLAVKAMK
jgi:squalene-hopene/tetraprenyl-beta-curcumene cyclase